MDVDTRLLRYFAAVVANGYGLSLTPQATASFYQRPGIAYRPVRGVNPSRVGIAWPAAGDHDPATQDFVNACRAARPAAE